MTQEYADNASGSHTTLKDGGQVHSVPIQPSKDGGKAFGSHTTSKDGDPNALQNALEDALNVATTADKPQATKKTVRRQQKVGRVVSDKMEKTRVIAVETLKKHRIYKRTYRQTKRFHVHDEENRSHIGDLVRIEESRPISKLKRWRLVEILKPGSGIVPAAEVVAQADPNLAGSREESGENALGSHTTSNDGEQVHSVPIQPSKDGGENALENALEKAFQEE